MAEQAAMRTLLVDVAVELLEQDGIGAVTVRSVARGAGLSHGAPRRYFPTQRAIHAAVAQRGLDNLRERIVHAVESKSRMHDRLRSAALEYVNFAQARPEMFALVFRHDLLSDSGANLRATSVPMFEIARGLLPDGSRGNNDIAAVQLWTAVHGIATLASTKALSVITDVDTTELLDRSIVSIVGTDHAENRE